MALPRNASSVLGLQEITSVLTISGAATTIYSYEWTLPIGAGQTTIYPSTATATTNEATATSPTTSTSTSQVTPLLKNSLSTGAKAGIGAGIAVFVILLGLGIFLFCRRRRPSRGHLLRSNEKGGFTTPYFSDASGRALAGSTIQSTQALDDHAAPHPKEPMPA